LREARFFSVISERTESTPDWFLKHERARSRQDKRGIDGFAQIYIDQIGRIKLPFQIKSSEMGAETHFEKYPLMRGVVMIIIVKDGYSDDELRRQLFSQADEIRNMILAVKHIEKSLNDASRIVYTETAPKCAGLFFL